MAGKMSVIQDYPFNQIRLQLGPPGWMAVISDITNAWTYTYAAWWRSSLCSHQGRSLWSLAKTWQLNKPRSLLKCHMVPVMTLLKVKVIQKARVYEEKLHILIRFPEPSSHDLAGIDFWPRLQGKNAGSSFGRLWKGNERYIRCS